MKTFLSAIAIASLVAVYSGVAQAYDPYYDDPYGSYDVNVQYVQPYYDPYYELHLIHYQLYLRPYSVYPYPYFVASPARVVVVGAPPVIGTPAISAPARVAQPARRR